MVDFGDGVNTEALQAQELGWRNATAVSVGSTQSVAASHPINPDQALLFDLAHESVAVGALHWAGKSFLAQRVSATWPSPTVDDEAFVLDGSQ